MLQVNYIRQHKEKVLERLAVKNFSETGLVDAVLALDDRRKRLTLQYDETQAGIKAASQEIGALMGQGKKAEAENKKKEVAAFKEKLQPIAEELNVVEKELHDTLIRLPNLPAEAVPKGKTPEDNVIVREGGQVPALSAGALPHWELAKKYGLIDFDLGNKITGSGFPVYRNKGARLQRALISYFLDYNTGSGYTEYQPPYLVNEATA